MENQSYDSCYVRHLIVLNICVKFRENISDGVVERTRMMKALMNGRSYISGLEGDLNIP